MEYKTKLLTLPLLYSVLQLVQSFTELPKFSQLLLLYPGYPHSGGQYHDRDLLQQIGATDLGDFSLHPHNTASLRMSWTLNRYSGRHAIGPQPVYLSHEGRDSVLGRDGQEYIYRNTAFGPYLAAKYGNPITIMLDPLHHNPNLTFTHFKDKQGMIRFISYHKDHAGGHIALWDCDHFHQTKDWSTEHHIISVEFWESPDSYCPPKSTDPTTPPKLVTLKPGTNVKVIARHNFQSRDSLTHPVSTNENVRHSVETLAAAGQGDEDPRKQKLRHKMERRRTRRRHREIRDAETLWVQEET